VAVQEKNFVDAWGVEMFYDLYAVDNPRAIIQLQHGIGEHAGRYVHVAAAFNAAGFSVYAMDGRGHGRTGVKQTGGDLSRLGRLGPGGLDAAVKAMHMMTEVIAEQNPNTPTVFIGHSMGSLMGQIMLNNHAADFEAAVLTGTAYRMPGSMNAGDLNKPFAVPGGSGYEWLSRDPEVAAKFKADPWTFDADVLKLFGVWDGLKLFGRPYLHMAEVPILIAVGSADSLGGEASALKLAKSYMYRAKQTDVTVIIYPDARHEIFNETNKTQVLDDVISWVLERVAR
jgi:alpha-beta hydrolase superfamily lysophospholipase